MGQKKTKQKKQKNKKPKELHGNAELNDIKMLFWITVTVVVTWWLLPGVQFSGPLMHNDGLLLLPRIQEYLDLKDWRKLVYRADTMGGIAFVDVYGKPLIYSFLSYFNVKAQTAMNIALIFTQVSIAFLAIRSSTSLAKKWSSEVLPVGLASTIGMTLLFAFIPVLGSRAQYGHLEIVWGLELFLIILSVGLSAQCSNFTRVQWLVVLITLFHCVPALGQQTKTYSIVFWWHYFIANFLVGELAGIQVLGCGKEKAFNVSGCYDCGLHFISTA